MKALIIYDSHYGNTAQIAHAIAAGLQQALTTSGIEGQIDVCKLGEVESRRGAYLAGLELLVIGSPTQRFSVTAAMRDFLQAIPKKTLAGVAVAGFDTRLTEAELHAHGRLLGKLVDWFGYAAPRISEELAKKGGKLAAAPEGFYVTATEGPLLAGETDRAMAWARNLLTHAP